MLYANIAREKITPEMGTCLFGYCPGIEANAVRDDIHITALALSDGDVRAMILSCDVCLIANSVKDRAIALVSAATGIKRENILLEANHTHSAPNLSGMRGWGEVDLAYLEGIFLPALKRAAVAASTDPVQVKLGIAVTESHVGINRRQVYRDGRAGLGQNPWGCYDPNMTVISLVDQNNEQLANLVHYGCHATAAGCNHEVTRDWFGVMLDALEAEYGGIAMFLNGAEGDVGPRLSNGGTTGDLADVEELGKLAAADALRCRAQVAEHREDVSFGVKCGEVNIPYKPMTDRETAERAMAAICERHSDPELLINLAYLEYDHYKTVIDMYKTGEAAPQSLSFPQSIFVLDDIALVPFPFEVFSAITRRLASYSEYRYTLSLSNTNGQYYYLPSKEDICRGGYEIGLFQFGNVCGLVDDADSIIISENLRIMDKG